MNKFRSKKKMSKTIEDIFTIPFIHKINDKKTLE